MITTSNLQNKSLPINNTAHSFERQSPFDKSRLNQFFSSSSHRTNNQQQNSIIWKVICQFSIEQYDILLTSKITFNTIEMSGQLLKNGQFFRISERSRAIQVFQYINNILNKNQSPFLIRVHPLKHTFEVNYFQNLTNSLKANVNSIMKRLRLVRQNLLQVMIEHGMRVLSIVGKCKTEYKHGRENDRTRQVQKIVTKTILDMFVISEHNTPLIQQRIIQEFQKSELQVQQVDEKQCLTKRVDRDTKNKNCKLQQIKQTKREQYYSYLFQQPYQKITPKERFQNFSLIYVGSKKPVQWKQIQSTNKYKLSLGYCNYCTHEQDINLDGSLENQIKKMLVLKQSKQTVHEKQIIKEGLQKISSNYILKYYDIGNNIEQKYKNSIIMDYHKISMFDYVSKQRKNMSNSSKFKIMIGISQGLRVLKNQNIIHMDLKPDNVMIAKGLCPKLIDFGESILISEQQQFSKNFSLPYVAPQFWDKDKTKLTTSFDTYSFGIILDNLIRNSFIFPNRRAGFHRLIQCLIDRSYPNLMYLNIEKYMRMLPQQTGQLMMVLILLCLHPVPEKRPNMDCVAIILQKIDEIDKLWVN